MTEKLKVLDLFSGIGGFSLGLEATGGFETVAFCEIDKFCQKVLKKHWPDVPIHEDVRTLNYDGEVDIITGGFPCQDISCSGNQEGIEGERSGLWSELCKHIGNFRPRFAIVENVSNLLAGPTEQRGGWFGKILSDLAAAGYDAEWHCIPTSSFGMAHPRDRVWIVAYPIEDRREGILCSFLSVIEEEGARWKSAALDTSRTFDARCRGDIQGEPALLGRNDVIPNHVDMLGGLGNAVSPIIPEMIGHAILESYKQ